MVTYDRVLNFAKEFFQRLHTECFIYGNVTKESALDIAATVNKRLEETNSVILPLLARQMLKKREYKLCNGKYYKKMDNKTLVYIIRHIITYNIRCKELANDINQRCSKCKK